MIKRATVEAGRVAQGFRVDLRFRMKHGDCLVTSNPLVLKFVRSIEQGLVGKPIR